MADTLHDKALEALLTRIASDATRGAAGEGINHLAEAYAWLVASDQSH
jgi:hypothetical protein